jgi:hypothetical protein
LQYALLSAGMGRRLGENNKPPTALTYEQVSGMIEMRSKQWSASLSPRARYMLAAPVIVDLCGWLGWLRGGELFGLSREDVDIICPEFGPIHGLPARVGAVNLMLDPATKSSPTRQADVVISYDSWSGLSFGLWMERLFGAMDDLNWTTGPLFRNPTDGKLWDSAYFRTVFLYPSLRWLRDCGMLSLQKYDDREHFSVEDWFYSMGCYRRGGRSAVSLHRLFNLRAATLDEVHEHGRWRKKGRVDASMPNHYREWTLRDRLSVTWLCS